VWDNDRRFDVVKLFALESLSRLPGSEVGGELVKIVTHEGVGPQIYTKAADALVARKDKEAVPLLVAELKQRYDHVQGTHPRATEVMARAIASAKAEEAWPALVEKLRDPAISTLAVKEIAVALRTIGAREAVPALREFLLMYRADPAFANDPGPLEAVAEAIGVLGSTKDRELLRYVAEESRTLDKLSTYVRHELEQTEAPAQGGGAGKPASE
jgi:HEAT repeat protein